jgi:hypothetical protein
VSVRYLLDEHIPPRLQAELIRREPGMVVHRVGEPGAPALGTLDPEILIWCEEHNCVLLTNNRRSMPRHLSEHLAAGHHVPGIFVVDMERSLADTVEDLILISLASFEAEYRDLIVYLPLS